MICIFWATPQTFFVFIKLFIKLYRKLRFIFPSTNSTNYILKISLKVFLIHKTRWCHSPHQFSRKSSFILFFIIKSTSSLIRNIWVQSLFDIEINRAKSFEHSDRVITGLTAFDFAIFVFFSLVLSPMGGWEVCLGPNLLHWPIWPYTFGNSPLLLWHARNPWVGHTITH